MTKESRMIKFYYSVNLYLFDGDGGAPAGASAAMGDANGNGGDANHNTGDSKTSVADSKNDGSDTAARRAKYDEYIKGEGKEFYTHDTQEMINRRFKQTKQLEAERDAHAPILDALYDRYKVENGNSKALMEAIDNDNAWLVEEAEEADMSVEQYKEMRKLQRQNDALLKQQEARIGQERAQAQMNAWNQQAAELAQMYPGFNLQEEAKNPEFIALLKKGMDVKNAYRMLHFDELMNNAAQAVAQKTQKAVVDTIRANGSRPSEAGLNSATGLVTNTDVNKLDKKQRAELAKRALKGEVIRFR